LRFEPYPFEKLSKLLSAIEPNNTLGLFDLTIGEPQFETPQIIQNTLKNNTHLLRKYPKSAGEDFLKESMAGFIRQRFEVEIFPQGELLPTFGTREVLFNFPQFFFE